MYARRDTGVLSVTLQSQTMEGLGREHIEDHRVVPPPAPLSVAEAVAALFGVKVTDGPQPAFYRPNRAERRAMARKSHKKARRRG